jgi:hypothetical protein
VNGRRGLLLLGLLAGVGCGGNCGGKIEPEAAEKPKATAPAAPQNGVIEGRVRLAPGYELPAYAQPQMERKVLAHTEHAPLPESCAPPKTTDRQPVKLADDGVSLSGVVVAGSQFSHAQKRAPMMHEVLIEDCRLKPSVVVAMKGDMLRVRSALDYPFMPAFGEEPVVRTLIRGQTYDAKLETPGVAPLLCGFTAPCGRTDVITLMHPVAAVTDAKGKFKIDAFPAGESVALSAWHPLFKESRIEVRVEPGETKQVELVLTPNVPQSPAPTPADAGPAKPTPQPAKP